MSGKHQPKAMGSLSASVEAEEGPRGQRGHRVNVPAGIERLLYLAAVDPGFQDRLLGDGVGAARAAGVPLSPSEEAMLRAAPRAHLLSSIQGLDVSPANLERRGFMKAVAASALAATAAGAVGCSDDADVKTKTDSKVKTDAYVPGGDAGVDMLMPDKGPPMVDKGGSRPDDLAPVDVMVDTHAGSFGILPDK